MLHSRALSDLAGYEEAIKLFEIVATRENHELLCQYACLCIDKAVLHEYLEDYTGADALYDRALNALDESKLENHVRAVATVTALANKATLLWRLGNGEQASALFDCLIQTTQNFSDILELPRIADIIVQGHIGMANIAREADKPLEAIHNCERVLDKISFVPDEVKALRRIHYLMAKANAENDLIDTSRALVTIQEAILSFKQNTDQLGDPSLFATLLLLKAAIMANDAKHDEAITLLTKAIDILDLVSSGLNQRDITALQASLHSAKAEALVITAEPEAALAEFDVADRLYQHLVVDNGRFDLAGAFTRVLSQRASTVQNTGELEPAIAAYDRAISIMERLVQMHKDWRLQNNLASVIENKANALADRGSRHIAFPLYDEAIALRKNLIGNVSHPSVILDLAVTYANKSEYILEDGLGSQALELCDEALHLLESNRSQQNEDEWDGYIGWVKAHRAEALAGCSRQDEAEIELIGAIPAIDLALRKSRAPRLRWVLEDAESVAKRIRSAKP
jgi:tetratricopeptide (TPR) repeat protein